MSQMSQYANARAARIAAAKKNVHMIGKIKDCTFQRVFWKSGRNPMKTS